MVILDTIKVLDHKYTKRGYTKLTNTSKFTDLTRNYNETKRYNDWFKFVRHYMVSEEALITRKIYKCRALPRY